MTDVAVPDDVGTHLEAGRLRPTRRMLIVPPLGLVLWAAGSNAGAGYLVVLAGGLLATIPWALWNARRAARTVHVRRELPAQAVAGQPVEVALHVRVDTVGAVVVHDDLTRSVGVVDQPRQTAVVRTQVTLPRGVPRDGRVTVEVNDPFGLFRVLVAGLVPARIEVLPPLHVANLPALLASARRSEVQRPRRRGAGSEADGTREYRHGDSPRAVHWRSSARRNELVVREFVGDASGRLRATIQPGAWDQDALDVACLLAASFLEAGQRSGADAELGLDGSAVPWTAQARVDLAELTPNLGTPVGRGAPPGPLPGATPIVSGSEVELVLAPRAGACEARLAVGGTGASLGELPPGIGERSLVAWLRDGMLSSGLVA